jgi:hypothetical protein
MYAVARAGWHNRLNRKSTRGRLDLYQLAPLLHTEAEFVTLQVELVSEKRLRRYKRKATATCHARLDELWKAYERNEVSTSKLLRSCAHLNGPIVD